MKRISEDSTEYEASEFENFDMEADEIETLLAPVDTLLQQRDLQLIVMVDGDGNVSVSISSYTLKDRVIEEFRRGSSEDSWTRRTVQSLVRETGLTQEQVEEVLADDEFSSSSGSRGRVYYELVD